MVKVRVQPISLFFITLEIDLTQRVSTFPDHPPSREVFHFRSRSAKMATELILSIKERFVCWLYRKDQESHSVLACLI